MKVPSSVLFLVVSAFAVPNVAIAESMFNDGVSIDDMGPPTNSMCYQYTADSYELCNEYCEVNRCFEKDTTDPDCSNLRTDFEMSTGGSAPPCDSSRCPCWEPSELAVIGVDVPQRETDSCDGNGLFDIRIQTNHPPPAELDGREGGFSAVIGSTPQCVTRGDRQPFLFLDITPEQACVCYSQIVSRCSALGTLNVDLVAFNGICQR